MSTAPLVVKYGGATMTDAGARAGIARALQRARSDGQPLVIVHGGGPAIGQALAAAGIPNEFVEGRRVTSDRALPVVEAALTLLGKHIAQEMGDALSLTGRDARLLIAEPIDPALGRVGRVTQVAAHRLTDLLSIGLTPVLACLALDAEGAALNVNADEAAGAVAGALTTSILYLSDVPGVLDDPDVDTSPLATLARHEAESRIADGRIAGGMIPKVRSALDALARGAASARIADGRSEETVQNALSGSGGTLIVPDDPMAGAARS